MSNYTYPFIATISLAWLLPWILIGDTYKNKMRYGLSRECTRCEYILWAIIGGPFIWAFSLLGLFVWTLMWLGEKANTAFNLSKLGNKALRVWANFIDNHCPFK